jgi:zinc metalloprotease ZmpA
VVHGSADGSAMDFSRTVEGALALDVTPRLASRDAATQALNAYPHAEGQIETVRLVVHAMGERPRLAWDVVVAGVQADGTPSRAHMIVDASVAQVIDQWDDIMTADNIGTGKTLYSGSVPLHDNKNSGKYTLQDLTRGKHKVMDMKSGTSSETLFSGTDNIWGNGSESSNETVAADAAYGQNMTWDYFLKVHGRKGIADDGNGARSRVHYGRNYDNAFWDDRCFCMTFGDGNRMSPLVALDVSGHEMTHGVTSRTAKLVYRGESGGLNEATSDIFGTMVEFYANNATDKPDYLLGENFDKPYTRNMISPNSDGYSSDCWYNGVGNLDVHGSSGVANHFFYLLAEGTTSGSPSKTCVSGNTKKATGSGTVKGIGRAKAEKIWYRALTVYMTSSETFARARLSTIKASNDLYGANSTESKAVAAAWTAVNRR